MNPYVFFVGCSRSGTTLLRRIANAHPQLAVIGEQHWLPRIWDRRVGLTPEGIVTAKLAEALLRQPRFSKVSVSPQRVAELVRDGAPKHYARFVSELFDLHGEAEGKPYVGEKTPAYVRYLPTLTELWPHTKVVHLIRDGRDVALSHLGWSRAERSVGRFSTWHQDRVTTAALFWEWNVRLGREAGAAIPADRYLEVSYEAFVADPGRECRSLCGFLGLPYEEAMLSFHEGKTRANGKLSAKKAWQPVTAGLRNWREQMPPRDVARFEAAAGSLLEELGYERATVASAEDIEYAERLREAFLANVRSRRRVPRAWESVAA